MTPELKPIAELVLRPAHSADSADLLRWRNDPLTRANSFEPQLVAPEEHGAWLLHSLASPARKLWIAELEGCSVGVVRLDLGSNEAELSWTIAPEFRGRGLGQRMVAAGLELAGGPATARIRVENQASLKIAERCGFRREADREGVSYWRTGA